MIDLTNPDSKQGAIDALSLLISAKNRPIRIKGGGGSNEDNGLKMPKNVEIVDVEEEEEENSEGETPEETAERVQKIKDSNTVDQIAKDLENIKNDREKKAAEDAKQAEEEEKRRKADEKRKNAPLVAKGKMRLSFKDFEDDLQDAIMDQIQVTRKMGRTFDKYNSVYANSDLLMPGHVRIEEPYHPVINVYFDLSGSCQAEVNATKKKLQFLENLKNDDVLDYTVYYFAEKVSKNPNEVGGGTTAFPEILRHVKKTSANNVIIVTDNDFDGQSGYIPDLPYVKVEGCVWWMWARDRMARQAWPHLTSISPLNTYHYKV